MNLAAAGEFGMAELRRLVVAPITEVEVRTPSESYDDTWTMTGYAAVFDQETTLYDGRFMRITESIAPDAFANVLQRQGLNTPQGVVHFNFGHNMETAVAATDIPAGQPGSLELRADARGLFYTARVSRDDPDAVRMAAKMRTGVLKQASFAFTIARKETTELELEDGRTEERDRIQEVGRLYDVCATPQGAYPQTVSQLRSYAAAIGWLRDAEAEQAARIAEFYAKHHHNAFDREAEARAAVRPEEGSGVGRKPLMNLRQREGIRALQPLR
jgi:HK97 family phage prohead protease